MTGLFADISVNPGGANGAFFGHPVQMWYQIAGILTAIGQCATVTRRERERETIIPFLVQVSLVLVRQAFSFHWILSSEFVCRPKKNCEDSIGSVSDLRYVRSSSEFVCHLAHGENWDVNARKPNGTTSTTRVLQPPPYSLQNQNEANKRRSRSRSKIQRQSQVRLRQDVSQVRPAYSRSQSQAEAANGVRGSNTRNSPV